MQRSVAKIVLSSHNECIKEAWAEYESYNQERKEQMKPFTVTISIDWSACHTHTRCTSRTRNTDLCEYQHWIFINILWEYINMCSNRMNSIRESPKKLISFWYLYWSDIGTRIHTSILSVKPFRTVAANMSGFCCVVYAIGKKDHVSCKNNQSTDWFNEYI